MKLLNSHKDVQDFISDVLRTNGDYDLVSGAPHVYFWDSLSYSDFINGNIPGVDPPTKILSRGNSANSNLIKVLKGTLPGFAQMPDGGTPFTDDQIASLADWIDRGCPEIVAVA